VYVSHFKYFGLGSLSLSDNILAVGNEYNRNNVTHELEGAVYMFVGHGSRWTQYAKLVDVSGYTSTMGYSVSYDASTGVLVSGSEEGKCLVKWDCWNVV